MVCEFGGYMHDGELFWNEVIRSLTGGEDEMQSQRDCDNRLKSRNKHLDCNENRPLHIGQHRLRMLFRLNAIFEDIRHIIYLDIQFVMVLIKICTGRTFQ